MALPDRGCLTVQTLPVTQGDVMALGRLLARGLVGGLFIGHGTQKLVGWFGGGGLAGTDAFMESLDMHPPRRNSLAAGVTETAGGALLAVGLATPAAAAALIGVMTTAIRKVHLANGPWVSNGGWEYNAVLIALLTALADDGPGDASLDAKLGIRATGPLWGLGALAVGVLASTATIEAGRAAGAARGGDSGAALGEAPGDPTTEH
jgi:putative oxidoreductase